MSTTSIIPKPITEYDLRLLRIFISVVEHGGFAAAENALGITRSTISVHMSNLETRMKLKLCLRGRGGFSLTEDGQSVYRAVLNLFDSINDFSLLVGTLGKELSGELVILCADQLDDKKQQKINNSDISYLRDLAVSIEKTNLKLAYELMAIVLRCRPKGSFIKRKKEGYEKQLGELNSEGNKGGFAGNWTNQHGYRSNQIGGKDINYIRDLAVNFEDTNPKQAYELMSIALRCRPNGLFLKKKKK